MSRIASMIPAVLGSLWTGSCRGTGSVERGGTQQLFGTAVPMTRLALDRHNSRIIMPARLLIADAEQWRRVTEALGASLPEPQGVDFSREMIVLVAAGSRGTTGYTITIDGVTR